MAVALNPRAERLLARLPRFTIYSALELLLLTLIAIQCARLFWAFLTPLGPIGEFKALDLIRPVSPPTTAAATGFDPFFRQAPGAPPTGPQAPAVVTSLDIRLFGVTVNNATGGGSAIIGSPTGEQRSVLVGEEIMPGVVLSAVGFDFVTITRGGAPEQLYLDQSSAPAAPAGNSPGNTPAIAPPAPLPRTTFTPTITPSPPPPPPPPPAMRPAAPPTARTLRVNQ